MNLFYHTQPLHVSEEILFDKEESRHISKVLRKKTGDILHITDGNGCLVTAQLTDTHPKQCKAQIMERMSKPPLPYHLHMAVAPTKTNDRFEWFLEKATEIGVSEITPIFCEHSERQHIKPERYEKILQSAMKQSLQAHLPRLNPGLSFKKFMEIQHPETLCCIAHCDESNKKPLKSLLSPGQSILLLIGPEGDFSAAEIALARQHQFVPVTLGDSRLRTETAAIVACHSVAFTNQ